MSQLPEQPSRTPVPTSADVARRAGVSRATVSYVLNNNTTVRISEPTRRRVREAAEGLGYVPHAAARSLRAGHTRTVLLPAAQPPLHESLIGTLESGLRQLDYTVVRHNSAGFDADEAARAWAELRPVAVLAPAGVSLTPYGMSVLTRSGARAVITLGPRSVEGAHALVLDEGETGRCAVRHLLARGRRRIGVVMPREPGLGPFAEARLAGAVSAVEESDVEAGVVPLPLGYEESAAEELAARWRSLRLDGVFGYDDQYAALLMRALQDAGVGVPAETSVIGAGDLVLGRLLRPRLSTVGTALAAPQPPAELVDRLIQNPHHERERHDLLRAAVVARESS
ncbi:LacI family DNA-binding transcriptional regulator [Streptomyces sp. NPDC059166]|uniref:LacI family DNA-binding transcriptional regulator n=1 Tax=Streptomyces sp. NPDC059166 TaxID=3346752 RepID=UPI0036BB65C6